MNKNDMQKLTNKIIALLIEERLARKISCYYISKDTGLSESTLHKIENFKQTPSLTTLLLISQSIGIKLSDLIAKVEK